MMSRAGSLQFGALLLFMLFAMAYGGSARALCLEEGAIGALAEEILAARPAQVPQVTTLAEGYCVQQKLVSLLQVHWGRPVGYKAGLTNPAVQARFGLSEPVRGALFGANLLDSGAVVDAQFGAHPVFEADLIAVVGSDKINQAQSLEEVAANLSALHPFIELADLVVEDPSTLDAAQIAAINVGARFGILGEAIVLDALAESPAESWAPSGSTGSTGSSGSSGSTQRAGTQNRPFGLDAGADARAGVMAEVIERLRVMRVRVTDQDDRVLSLSEGSSLMGHPLNVVLWLRDSGLTLREGDRLSLGSFGAFLKPKAGLVATVTYEGLPGAPQISVRFD